MSNITYLSARFANADGTAMVVATQQAGDILISQVDNPEQWAAAIETVGAPTPYADPPFTPSAVGKGQGTVWLHRAGKLAAIEAYISASTDTELKLWWDKCTEFRIDNPYVVALAVTFGIDLPTAFREAASIAG